jgi:hypothetical protein
VPTDPLVRASHQGNPLFSSHVSTLISASGRCKGPQVTDRDNLRTLGVEQLAAVNLQVMNNT